MAQLFKKNIVKEKLQNFEIPDFDEKLNIVKKWHDYYHNGTLKTDKEISVAPGFTQDFLGEILDYIRKPAENHTYDTEYSIAGQRPDFVLGYLNIKKSFIIGELKDAKTSLDAPQKREGSISPIQQAFKYKGGLRDSSFVIVSNFFETRLYYDNHLDFEVWTLDDLVNTKNNYFNFRKFYYLLCEKNLIAKSGDSNTKSLLSLIRIQEKEITKQFYKEYTVLRKELFKDIVSNNSFKKSELDFVLNKTQKIIDRIIFIHFCEDLGLLPNGKLNEVVEYGEKSLSTTWETLQNFFRAVDKGSEKLGIPDGYNGGLFHHDEDLSNLKVGDKICKKFVELGDYDFEDDLSVNILGHIFEQSISDIEELKDKINKEEEVSLSKRKKDGVFYTPEYIVDYIVKNSVGKKIDDWETELKEKHKLKEDITDKNYNKRAILVYEELQEKVHNIKVIDPACGSGAFLVKVFDYLLDKNKEIANKLQDLSGSNAISMFQTEAYFKDILKNNIFGVDLNEESVEISKLSLWLKTASKGKKLANLDGNIKCGNSLIDDFEIAGDKAFVWETEFKDIFDDGGFDVVVGNPPYVSSKQINKQDKKYYENEYQSAKNQYDLYSLFIEKSIRLLNNKSYFSFIVPDKFLISKYGEALFEIISDKIIIKKFWDLTSKNIFPDASVYPIIFVFQKNINKIKSPIFTKDDFLLVSDNEEKNPSKKIIEKMESIKSIIDFKVWRPLATSKNIYEGGSEKIISNGEVSRYLLSPKIGKGINGYRSYENKKGKILIKKLCYNLEAGLDNEGFIPINTTYCLVSENNLNYILVLLNSKLLSYYARNKYISTALSGGYIELRVFQVAKLPIKNISLSEQTPFIDKADFMLDKNKELGEKISKFLKRLNGSFEIEKLSNKLKRFYELEFSEFVKELKKKKISMSLVEQDEWEEYFDSYKSVIVELKSEIDKCDSEIDNMVFELYGLSEEERGVIRG